MKRPAYIRASSVAAVVLAALTFATAVNAQLLGLTKDLPIIRFDSGGVASYDGAIFSVNASALSIAFVPPSPISLPPQIFPAAGGIGQFGRLTIKVAVNSAGAMVAGENSMEITGRVTLPNGAGVADGLLLAGKVTAFGYRNDPDEFDMRVTITDGLLQSFFAGKDLYIPVTSNPIPGSPVDTTFTGSFAVPFRGGATGEAGATDKVQAIPFPDPPTITITATTALPAEATGPGGASVSFTVVATGSDPLEAAPVVTCSHPSPSMFPLLLPPAPVRVSCTATDVFGSTTAYLDVLVVDTTPPILTGADVEVQATSASGAKISLPVTACNFLGNPCDGAPLPVTCTAGSGAPFDPTTEYQFAIGTTTVSCSAIDPAGNIGVLSPALTVTVKDKQPPAPREGCFIVDFREITYFNGYRVITSSDAGIRARNGIIGDFNPSLWPYRAAGGTGYTKSRGTLFRIYGFQPSEKDQEVPDADDPWTSYIVSYDADSRGYYIDLGGPARAVVCAEQLQEFVLTGKKGNGHKGLSTLLPQSQRNVPGIMLSHNSQIVKLPKRVRAELYALGMDVGPRGLIDYIGFQLQGDGNASFREFVDVEISFPSDSETDRVQHYTSGFHTALNTSFESFAGCNYIDYAPGNDAVRLRNVWGPNRSKWWNYNASLACGAREPSLNQRQRANYDVPFNAIQILPAVNVSTDTLRLFFGAIAPIPERERGARDHRVDWSDWDRWDW